MVSQPRGPGGSAKEPAARAAFAAAVLAMERAVSAGVRLRRLRGRGTLVTRP
jgi:hypothetical protein